MYLDRWMDKDEVCEMIIFPAISINNKCDGHQWFLASKCYEGSQNCNSTDVATPYCDCWGTGGTQEAAICHSLRWTRKQDLPPDSWGVSERSEISEPRCLHLPIHRTINSLTWYLIFNVQIACSLCCKLVYSLISPPASLEQFSQSYWDAVSQAQSPEHFPPNKITLYFQVVTVFF